MSEFSLGNLQVLGSAATADKLYFLQNKQNGYINVTNADGAIETRLAPGEFILTTIDLTALPEIRVLSRATFKTEKPWISIPKAVWPNERTLVWAASDVGRYWSWSDTPVYLLGRPAFGVGMNVRFRPYYWMIGDSARFIAFDVSKPSTPALEIGRAHV